ncbi:SWI/SNF-related matrix-associated actin-dependent regulator of chromatin subfamily A containing DEAD/H box 1A-like [Cynoglossus semilaevis]|uniref:DNA helicase n=2 Tax=Cynoglossus semilaevis TaxID=244447 RepID=A0A3P8W514_CYNSE|nr:SWI/SNF-related matrix-associated actin-dependent regulator of chromatin subfamily A containing DEAD/H box 1A-like [Cynoglossus semilaevis]
MSVFNLDRFRFDKNVTTSANKEQGNGFKSPESEKENRPEKMKSNKAPPKNRGVDSEDEVPSPPKIKVASKKRFVNPKHKLSIHTISDDEGNKMEDKINRLLEMFPRLTRTQVLKVIKSTSTLDGAVAACLLEYGDKEEPNKKRKVDERSNSQDGGQDQPRKKRQPSLVSEEEEEGGDDDDCDDDNEEKEPSWEKQEAMVRRLQRKFPDQDKEELRMVLQEHNWDDEEALQVLQMFSDPVSCSSPDSKKETSNKLKHKDKSNRTHRKRHKHVEGLIIISETDLDSANDSEARKQSENESDVEVTSRASTLSTWLQKESKPVSSSSSLKNEYSSTSKKNSSTSAAAQMLSRFASGTSLASLAKKQAAESKRKARAMKEHVSSEGESDGGEDTVSSEFDDSDNEPDSNTAMTGIKQEMLDFFKEASLDELSQISGCSVKKASRIIEMRPFKKWQTLVEILQKENGLSEHLLVGCKHFLKERKVVLGLMSKCETISSKMVKQVTKVMESGTGAKKQPSLLNSQLHLKPYQLIGLKWLLLLHEHKLSAILADEMGLGKTIQAISFLAQLYENGIEGPYLITVPSSTLDNWVRELKLWCPSLSVLVYYGSVEDRRYLRHDILSGKTHFNVIVTTYNLAIGNDNDRSLFRKLKLKYAVFDEGHMLKNMSTLRYRHLMSINAEHRLLLTGTPLQNNLLELISLLNFIMPSMFSSSTTQLTKMFSMKSQVESRFERDRISQAKLIMKPFILRRVKSEVLKQLPAKEEKVEYCLMSEKQKVLYDKLLKKLKLSTTGKNRELCNVMMQLRKMANHPLLHRQYYTTKKLKAMSKLMLKDPSHYDADAALIQEDMEIMSDFELHGLCKQYTSISSYQLEKDILLDSGKFHYLTELLASHKDKGDRVVLFSQFTMMLDIVEVLLKHLKHRYVRLDGSTPIADRIVLIDEFNTAPDIFVFLLSTRAGGLGINLTSANVVILHDIDCNPYNDKQAEDRCHRVGQSRTVKVIRLISKDSIEDGILQLGQKKLKLEKDMTAADEDGETTITEDMASLLKASLGL